jgi:hypothetical protein
MKKTLLAVLFLGILVNIGLVAIQRKAGFFYRTCAVKSFDAISYRFREETPKTFSCFKATSPECIMQKVMNFVPGDKRFVLYSEKIKDIYEHAKKGGGLNCNGMAELFIYALRSQGYTCRKLFLVKDIGSSFATHTVVEVFQDGKWVLYDPTFNVSFSKHDKMLQAKDIYKSLLNGSLQDIKPIFYGNVAYPARLATYPIFWAVHFNNILLFDPGIQADWRSFFKVLFLPLRYWQGPILYYISLNGQAHTNLWILNQIYLFSVLFLPLILLSLFFLLLCSFPLKTKNAFKLK